MPRYYSRRNLKRRIPSKGKKGSSGRHERGRKKGIMKKKREAERRAGRDRGPSLNMFKISPADIEQRMEEKTGSIMAKTRMPEGKARQVAADRLLGFGFWRVWEKELGKRGRAADLEQFIRRWMKIYGPNYPF